MDSPTAVPRQELRDRFNMYLDFNLIKEALSSLSVHSSGIEAPRVHFSRECAGSLLGAPLGPPPPPSTTPFFSALASPGQSPGGSFGRR